MTTLCEVFAASVRRYPDRVMLHYKEQDWTYAEIWSKANALAAWFRINGLRRGERVGLLLANSPDYVIGYLGVLLAEGIVVALNPDTTVRDLSHTLAHCEPAAVIVSQQAQAALTNVEGRLPTLRLMVHVSDDGLRQRSYGRRATTLTEALKTPPQTAIPAQAKPSDIAQIIYTSGTSGRPKGVTLNHANLVANCQSIVQYLDLGAEDSVLVILPFFYSYGNSLLITHLAVGGRMILAEHFVFWNQALDLMEQQRATGFAGVPSTFAMLLHRSDFARRAFPNLRYLTCAGGALAPANVEQIQQSMPAVRLFLMYGQTEAAARLSTLLPEEIATKLGSIGRGIPGVSLQVVNEAGQPTETGEVGEIVASGENIMVGYWNDPGATRETLTSAGLRTGDLAWRDEDGYLFIVGRSSDIIKCGAYRIHPQEIEEVIQELPGVAEVAVTGEPDDVLGEVAAAFIVTSRRAAPLDEQQVIDHAKRGLPRHKQIRKVYFVESLPKTSSGKIRRSQLRGKFQSDALPEGV